MTTLAVLRAKQVAEKVGVSRSTLWNWVNPKSRHYNPDFPQPFTVSGNVTGWRNTDIDAYINKQAQTPLSEENREAMSRVSKAAKSGKGA